MQEIVNKYKGASSAGITDNGDFTNPLHWEKLLFQLFVD